MGLALLVSVIFIVDVKTYTLTKYNSSFTIYGMFNCVKAERFADW